MKRRRKVRAALTLALGVSTLTFPAYGAKGGAGDPEFRSKMLKILMKKGFVRNATCSQFASAVLTRNGLPALGKREPVKGERGDLDRRGERKSPPEFVDQIRPKADPATQLKFKAIARENASLWHFELERIQAQKEGNPPARSITVFRFKPGSAANKPSCELQSIGFSASWLTPEGRPAAPLAISLGADQCLDAFDPAVDAAEEDPMRKRLNAWLKIDCALGLRYFESVKRQASSTRR